MCTTYTVVTNSYQNQKYKHVKEQILPRPLDEYWREEACGEQEGYDRHVDEHGRVAHGDAARVDVEEGVAGDEWGRGEEAGGDPDPREHGGRVESGNEAVVDAVQ